MSENYIAQIQVDPETSEMLKSGGIFSFDRLKELGTEQAFLRIISNNPSACLSLLYKIEGIISGVRWTELPIERMQELNQIYSLTHKGEKC